MGYSTSYELNVKDTDGNLVESDELKEIIAKLFEISEIAEYALDDEGSCANPATWYESNEDMRELSKLYPTHLFILWGEGEDSEDLWKSYFRNGRIQQEFAKITYGEFDETKLV